MVGCKEGPKTLLILGNCFVWINKFNFFPLKEEKQRYQWLSFKQWTEMHD